MKVTRCSDVPTQRITYNIGFGNKSIFEICDRCADDPIFQSNIISLEKLK